MRYLFLFVAFVFALFLSQNDFAHAKNNKERAEKFLKHIEASKFGEWEQEQSTVFYENNAEDIRKGYKVVVNGEEQRVEKLPDDPNSVEKVYARQNPSGFEYVATEKGRQYQWTRLYWNPEEKKWLPAHPNLSKFTREQLNVQMFLFEVNDAFDSDASYGLPIALFRLKQVKPEQMAEVKKQINELVEKAGAKWGGTDLLKKVYEINIEIERAEIGDKVKLADKRRPLFRQIFEKASPMLADKDDRAPKRKTVKASESPAKTEPASPAGTSSGTSGAKSPVAADPQGNDPKNDVVPERELKNNPPDSIADAGKNAEPPKRSAPKSAPSSEGSTLSGDEDIYALLMLLLVM